MDLHANAALSWSGRRELARRVVEQGWTLTAAAEAAGVSVRCARKWVNRYRGGDRVLLDRSSAPRRVANRTPAERVAAIVRLRRLRMTAAEIAETLQMPLSTVSGILTLAASCQQACLALQRAARTGRTAGRKLGRPKKCKPRLRITARDAGCGYRLRRCRRRIALLRWRPTPLFPNRCSPVPRGCRRAATTPTR
jgi:hypothetical protein